MHAAGLMLVLVYLSFGHFFPTAGQTTTPPWNSVWVPAKNLPTPRYQHTATLLENGQVLVAGGISDFFEESTAILYDYTGEWTETGSMTLGRASHTATLLTDGRVLVVGGFSHESNGVTPSAEVYDPATGSWRAVARLNRVRCCYTATLLGNGKVLVAGGEYEGGPSSAELYDAATNTWSMTGDLNEKRWCHVAVLLENGKVLVAGDGAGSAELYDPETGQWSFVEPLNPNFSAASATRLADGRVLVTGSGADTLTTAELYDPATAQWRTTAPLALVGGRHTATLLADGQVLLAGGSNLNGYVVGGAELYNPATDTWSTAAHLLSARALHTATLPDGKVLVTGGVEDFIDDANRRPTDLNSAELFDPGTIPCAAQISPTNQFFSSMGGDGSVNLTTGCNWTVSNDSNSIALTSPDSGSGPSTVTFEVKENFTGGSRSGVIVIAGRNFTVVQDGGLGEDCEYSISPQFQSFSASGGTGLVSVLTNNRCAWEVMSNVSWITIT